ncbi:hypothetical protein XENTR_v10014643 [Xenopus tropicalis]|nr:hypothetical protein XENTR_v10014643 [Xenopus tropicalis]
MGALMEAAHVLTALHMMRHVTTARIRACPVQLSTWPTTDPWPSGGGTLTYPSLWIHSQYTQVTHYFNFCTYTFFHVFLCRTFLALFAIVH